ncbi:cohesin subunit rad21-like [Asparagus officinalis]|uniref:cohesin subunit rad21-like n=1 Tax=Asparagus officinalis TaxID=4686 RepID=UPI00098E0B96|nr:cohesin subunit rad21-like [Asparagus officinalis]
MFYSHTFLAKKSPLGIVWIAAHLERKIKKHQLNEIDVAFYAGEAVHAPFESLTLPCTFNLDAMELDYYPIDEPDNHRKRHDQITIQGSIQRSNRRRSFISQVSV